MAGLTLSRKQYEKIRIADDIVITVMRLGIGSVDIRIEADPSIKILREEVYQRTQEAKECTDAQ